MGVRTEIKNIGSVRAVAAAVKYEINRQISILEAGNEIFNETRAWNVVNKKTIPMREKEEKEVMYHFLFLCCCSQQILSLNYEKHLQDYRFMPETNLPPLRIHVREDLSNENNLVDAVILKKQLPELPEQIRERLRNVLQISPEIIVALMVDFSALQSNKYVQKMFLIFRIFLE